MATKRVDESPSSDELLVKRDILAFRISRLASAPRAPSSARQSSHPSRTAPADHDQPEADPERLPYRWSLPFHLMASRTKFPTVPLHRLNRKALFHEHPIIASGEPRVRSPPMMWRDIHSHCSSIGISRSNTPMVASRRQQP